MSFDVERLYELLPAVYRARDVEEGLPLKAVLSVIAEQVAVVEEDLAQLYDDQFIETCAEWVVPYIGDLVGDRGLYDLRGTVSQSQRAQVANTLTYRRRKGTTAVLEQVARDVTGWSAHAVEFFQVLATTQYTNHIRPNNLASPDLRQWEPLERANTPFDTLSHTAEVRSIASQRGRYNIPNAGIFLWRVGAYSATKSPAYKLKPEASDRRYRFSPLGNDTPLYNHPETEGQITQLAGPLNVPMPVSRRVLDSYLEDYYGKSILLFEGANQVPANDVIVCDLSDWVRKPQEKYAIDPELGRISSPENRDAPSDLRVTYYYGFSADMGGGEYGRTLSPYPGGQTIETVPPGTIQQALDAVSAGGFVEITDSGRYQETPSIHVTAVDGRLEIRARDRHRPTVELGDVLNISGVQGTEVTLDGLLISGGTLRVDAGADNKLRQLRLRHCTLVPGLSIGVREDGTTLQSPSAPSLIVGAANVSVEIDRCIVGGLRVADGSRVQITNSIVDATAESAVAYAALDEEGPGGTLRVKNTTIIGKVHTGLMELASNTIFLSGLAEEDAWEAPVHCERLQQGCVRFSYLPLESRTPRRHRCRPEDGDEAVRVRPQFSSLRYGAPDYCQLAPLCAVEIRQGADDEAEMGAFHDLYQPQRETNLRVRLKEYLRFGLEAGVFYAS